MDLATVYAIGACMRDPFTINIADKVKTGISIVLL